MRHESVDVKKGGKKIKQDRTIKIEPDISKRLVLNRVPEILGFLCPRVSLQLQSFQNYYYATYFAKNISIIYGNHQIN